MVKHVSHKAGLLGLAHLTEIENGGNGRCGQKVAKRVTGLAGNRDVGMWPAKNRDRKAG